MSIITLLTDFGYDDEYVGVMKGVILSINPAANIVDISHTVDPQDTLQAALLIEAAWSYFPKGTVHVLVVDPGVGSQREIAAIQMKGHIFLAPDNGVLTRLLESNDIENAVRIENPEFFLHPVSDTFHGRDIFAPVSAHLASGLSMGNLGKTISHRKLVRLPIPAPTSTRSNELTGMVLAIDRFGNLITNIRHTEVERFSERWGTRTPEIRIGDQKVVGISRSYRQAEAGEAIAVIGSRRYLEIAVNCGNAGEFFKAQKGDAVHMRWPRK